MKYGDGIVSESWYFQVVLEIGIVGLLLWSLFFYFVLKQSQQEPGLLFGLLAILVMTAFLHTLSDNPAITFTLFAFVGIKTND
jgi:O-antigen ligase